MESINPSTYQAPFWLRGGHLQTLYPYFTRRFNVTYQRERIELPDDDFVDIDWLLANQQESDLLILCHGLEGSSQSQYILGMADFARMNGLDSVAINFRSCSGEPNRKLASYHHGHIDDLVYLVDLITNRYPNRRLQLVGYSLGGNVICKYLGVHSSIPDSVTSAIVVSVPSDLKSSSTALDHWTNTLYTINFRRNLREKFEIKDRMFPGLLPMEQFDSVKSWAEFDSLFTCAIYGFENSDAYYKQGSANEFIPYIHHPLIMINARNDPFLRSPSYPLPLFQKKENLLMLTPKHGGHVGFWQERSSYTWVDEFVVQFITQKGYEQYPLKKIIY